LFIKNLPVIVLFLAYPYLAQAAGDGLTPTATPFTLGGKFGFGADQMDGDGFSPSIRYWLNDQTALEVLGSNYMDSWGCALGVLQNIAHPTRDVYIHLLSRYTFNQYSNPNVSSLTNYSSITLGIGFEAFMPFCENLSLDGWVGLEVDGQTVFPNSSANLNTLTGSLGSLMNLAVHFYL
jgi:hypothetical protein